MIARAQYEYRALAGCYNVGPDDADCVTTGALAGLFCEKWGGVSWQSRYDGGPHEANFLKLDCSKIKSVFGWQPRLNIAEAVKKTVEWSKVWAGGRDVSACMEDQIREYLNI